MLFDTSRPKRWIREDEVQCIRRVVAYRGVLYTWVKSYRNILFSFLLVKQGSLLNVSILTKQEKCCDLDYEYRFGIKPNSAGFISK